MLTFYKIDAKHAHHRSPPRYINTSQYIQQRPNTIYRIGCQLLRIANTNIYRDTSVLIPSLRRTAQPGPDGAGGTTNCRRCADGLRRGLGSFTMGKPALRPSPAAGACHVGSVPKGSFFLSIRKNMGQESRSLPAASRV